MQNEWQISGRSDCCTRTGKPFLEGEFFYTLLYREGDGFRREDICEEAWENRNDNIVPFSYWRTKYTPPPPPEPEPLKREDAESLLRRLVQERNPANQNAAYILALMLERKKILRPLETSDDDSLLYEHIQSGETFIIPNPHLSLDRIEEVQKEVAELLSSSLGTPSA